ncbi:hypothetical protein RDWZM_007860 [Blomia tropicalis]|uniref:ANKLE2 third alpha/beta domain-containing protein n=1 Tax=Blomia tropicalis TaxID=40697 RepID=A0A9Q0M109_BLOTA|nr:hypothetical protein RDWZM_007860 [Blomia tropicalis]
MAQDLPSNPIYYYAVFIPSEAQKCTDNKTKFSSQDLVSTDRKKIIDISRKYKSSRFKRFKTISEALQFATHGDSCNSFELDTSIGKDQQSQSTIVNNKRAIIAESPLPFQSLDIPSLNKFKNDIRDNNLNRVISCVSENPRYLLTYNYDGPTILMAGPHYNAVHLAIRHEVPQILRFILNTIDSYQFIKRCYPMLNDENIDIKRRHILDLYLNTPEKILFNTPLHIACIKQNIECISILLEYVPMITLDQRNKMKQLPYELIRDEILRTKIEQRFESCMFVTIVRSDDKLDYSINTPSYGRKSLPITKSESRDLMNAHSNLSVIIGPTSPDNARLLYESLRSPTKCTKEQRSIRLKDPIHGVELVARSISQQLNVPCEEYWPFLDDYVDIASEEGLQRLNHYLEEQYNLYNAKCIEINSLCDRFTSLELDEKKQLNSTCVINGDENYMDHDNYYDAILNINGDYVDDEVFYTAPSSPQLYDEDTRPDIVFTKPLFINGVGWSWQDRNAHCAIQLAINNGTITIDQRRYPFLYHWYNSENNG